MNIDLEDILLKSHIIFLVSEGSCCYSDNISCECGWSGDPSDYGIHLLVVLGQDEIVINRWKRHLTYSVTKNPSEESITAYLNSFRAPKDKRI
jgi:hypothetical protein